MIGIELNYHNGKQDWYDPVDREEFYNNQTHSYYIFDVGGCTYKVDKLLVGSVREYELCDVCGYEHGTCEHTDGVEE